jgi:hypothetical protein
MLAALPHSPFTSRGIAPTDFRSKEANILLLARMLVSAGCTSVDSTMDPFEVCELP